MDNVNHEPRGNDAPGAAKFHEGKHTPGPWRALSHGQWVVPGVALCGSGELSEANARLIAASPDMLEALNAACGYLLNAKIDLETGAPKRAAIQTIEGGLKVVRAAIARATGAP